MQIIFQVIFVAYTFFYTIIVVILIILIISLYLHRKQLEAAILTGVIYIGYTMLFDVFFGETLKLYHYINPELSSLYILISAVFLYPPTIIIFLLFLPKKNVNIVLYTVSWIAVLLLFEKISFMTHTVVLTGWKYFPWSPFTYIVTLSLSILVYKLLHRRLKK